MTITEAPEEVTQAKEKLFIHGMPVTYTPPDGLPKQATYDEGFRSVYANKHTITLLVDGTSVVVNGSEITPNRPLTDVEMVANLTEQMYEMNKDVERLRNQVVKMEQDGETISTALLEEAQSRGWCVEYNQFCEEVNSKLQMLVLQPQESEYEVSGKLKVTASLGDTEVTVECDFTATVTATSPEEAQSIVDDDPTAYFDPEHLAVTAIRAGWDSIEVDFN